MTIIILNIPRGFSPFFFFFMETPVTQYMKVEEQVWDSVEFPDPDLPFLPSYDRLK